VLKLVGIKPTAIEQKIMKNKSSIAVLFINTFQIPSFSNKKTTAI